MVGVINQYVFVSLHSIVMHLEVMLQMQQIMSCFVVPDDGIRAAMTRCWRENEYLLCPHTAVAAKYHYDTKRHSDKAGPVPRICLATASPAKFEEAVLNAGLTPQPTEAIKALDQLPTRCLDMKQGDDWTQILRQKIVDVSKPYMT